MKLANSFGIKNYNSVIHALSVLLFFTCLYILFFSPVLFSEKLLAPGDGILYSVPAFYSPRKLWTDLLLSGFPVAADIQVQTWYPISLLFSLIPNSWNSFVLSAYVLASCFSYGYVYSVTLSKLGALVSGIIYGMSGFMVAHLGHPMMIHTALWIPLLIWALEKLRHHFSPVWLATGVVAVTCTFLAGHPQIFVYAMGLSAAYAFVLGWSTPISRWKYYRFCISVFVLGIALCSIQLIPSIELANRSSRSAISFNEFVTYSLPLNQLHVIIFPYLFGGSPSSFYKLPYLGEWNLTELTGYVGLMPIILAVIGFLFHQNKSLKRFWFFVAVLAMLLTLGRTTPLAKFMYVLPAYNKFRAPARHFIEVALAISSLAGLGVAALQKQVVSHRLLRRVILAGFGLMLVSLFGIFLIAEQLQAKIINTGFKEPTLLPWLNPAIGIPLVVFFLVTITLLYWYQSPNSKFRAVWLLFVLILDLGSFGWFYEWQYNAPTKDILKPTVSAQHYKEVLSANQQRILPIKGGLGSLDTIPPNLSRLWGVPSGSGYGSLILSRVSRLFSMTPAGDVVGNWASRANKSLDIMSIRYIFVPKPSTITGSKGISWSTEDMSTALGTGCGTEEPNSVKFQVSGEISATAIGIVSSLGCSQGISNDAEVLRIVVTNDKGRAVTQSLRAGRDTSEWSYECGDSLANIQHRQAPIFESFPVQKEDFSACKGHKYVSILPLNRLNNVKLLELEWMGSSGAIGLKKISLFDEDSQQSYPIAELADSAHWFHVEDIKETQVYKNLRAMPRAWLVPEVMSATSDEILNAIKSSKLPSGRLFEPSKIALVKKNLDFKVQNFDENGTADVVKSSDSIIEIKTKSSSEAFLILSDIDYPGWQATVDGNKTLIYKTDYVLRGVKIPAGNHLIKFEFKPLSFDIGVGLSTSALLLLAYLLLKKEKDTETETKEI